ncbi:MAG TPA: hypothetical protein VMB24_06245, partial [Dehalococcoidales bacterium]|nr:hypothetical protein [Dehalococcoidales bacterium]
MIRKILFAVVLAIFLVPWTAAYAHNVANADTIPVDIQPAPAASQPAFNVFGNAIGSVIPGDLFFIDCSGNQADTEFNLYITNADALIKNYRFVNLQIGLYTEKESGAWQKITKSTGQSAEDFYITIQDCR